MFCPPKKDSIDLLLQDRESPSSPQIRISKIFHPTLISASHQPPVAMHFEKKKEGKFHAHGPWLRFCSWALDIVVELEEGIGKEREYKKTWEIGWTKGK